ncbi:MAG: GAF domain-containing protein [Actinomycetota bacterium]
MKAERRLGDFIRPFVDISLQLTQDLDLGQVLVTIVERARELTDADYGAALTLDDRGDVDDFLHRGLTAEEVAALPHLPRGRGLLGLVLEQRRALRIEDLPAHPESVGFPDAHVPMTAFLGVPMTARGILVGALYLTKKPGRPPFSPADEELIHALAAMAGVAVQNARLFEAEKGRAERTALLGEIAYRIRSSLDLREVLEATVEQLGRAAGVDRCFLRLVAEEGSERLGPIAHEWDAPGVPSLQQDPWQQYPVSLLAARDRRTLWSDDVLSDERLGNGSTASPEDLVLIKARAVLSTPLEWGEELLGVVTLHARLPRPWSGQDVALIEAAAREVAVGLHHARLYHEALEAATRLQELDLMRSEFVSVVSHELRSPMTVIAGIAGILHKRFDRLDEAQRTELIETLGREARRLTRLVSEALDLEAIDRGGVELRMQPVDVAELAHEAVADAGQAERAEIGIAGGDTSVTADRDKVKQVMLNLLSNAEKFSPEDQPVALSVASEEGSVTVSVADRGPGIPEDERHLLFQRFSRLQSSGVRKPGSGIGLYLSKSIVERHGGQIWVESSPGEGSTFSFRLPRRPGEAAGIRAGAG